MRHEILQVLIEAQSFEAAMLTLIEWLEGSEKRYVSTCTANTITQAQRRPLVMSALHNASMVTADGMPLVWLQRAAGFHCAERVYGPDILLSLCRRTEQGPMRHYFVGGGPGVAERLVGKLREAFPGLKIVGWLTPVVAGSGETIDPEIVAAINRADPQVIWIGLGSPKQDVWMDHYRPYLKAPLIIGVGAAFDFVAGTKPQAPRWMRRVGLEWLFRLLTEPRRLWRRYLIYNTLFVYYLLCQWIKAHFRGQDREP